MWISRPAVPLKRLFFNAIHLLKDLRFSRKTLIFNNFIDVLSIYMTENKRVDLYSETAVSTLGNMNIFIDSVKCCIMTQKSFSTPVALFVKKQCMAMQKLLQYRPIFMKPSVDHTWTADYNRIKYRHCSPNHHHRALILVKDTRGWPAEEGSVMLLKLSEVNMLAVFTWVIVKSVVQTLSLSSFEFSLVTVIDRLYGPGIPHKLDWWPLSRLLHKNRGSLLWEANSFADSSKNKYVWLGWSGIDPESLLHIRTVVWLE